MYDVHSNIVFGCGELETVWKSIIEEVLRQNVGAVGNCAVVTSNGSVLKNMLLQGRKTYINLAILFQKKKYIYLKQ